MTIRRPVGGLERAAWVATALAVALGCAPARAAPPFRLEKVAPAGAQDAKDAEGLVRPFKTVGLPLADFVREYARHTSTPITAPGSWADELRGTVTLFLRRPLTADALTELFHRVLSDNGYAVVDAPAGNGWVVDKMRNARDQALPVYELSEVPATARTVTAYRDLKHADAEMVARVLRSFMPAHSRIIPSTPSQLFITDAASNVRKLAWVIERMDVPDARRIPKESRAKAKSCGEQRIEKLVVEKLEIQQQSDGGGSPLPPAKRPSEGGRK
jgi:type II secretory pathway component GspD/PulD (secretin)